MYKTLTGFLPRKVKKEWKKSFSEYISLKKTLKDCSAVIIIDLK